MAERPLEREYGVLLGGLGPQALERAHWYRLMAEMAAEEGCPKAEAYLRMQADRAEQTVRALIKEFERAR